MMIFFGVMLLIFALFDFITLNKWKKFIVSREKNKYLYIIPFWFGIIMIIIFIYTNYNNFLVFPLPEHIKYFNILISFWYLPKILISPIILFIDFSDKIRLLIKKLLKPKILVENSDIKLLSSRRKFAGNLAWSVAGIPFLLAYKGLMFTVNEIRIFGEEIILPKLATELSGLKIVQLSDLHFGTFISKDYLNNILKKVESLEPDLIFVTGDFVNFRYEELDYGETFLNELKATYGVFACLGNHDHYMKIEDHQKLIKRINKTGTKLLINENKTIKIKGQEINIVGVDNFGSRQTFGDFDKAFTGVNSDNLTILMSHDPNTWEQFVVGKKQADITLSGHTHGGQVSFEFLGYDLSIAKMIYKYYKGLHSIGSQYLYVNRGIGVSGPPIRLGINPEITFITLKKPLNFTQN
jgi:predicted MPP superfamily phosphohydrolase